jgi:hypothetical protein
MIQLIEIKQLYNSLVNIDYKEIDQLLVVKEILSYINEIEPNAIDPNHSTCGVNEETQCFVIRLISNNSSKCELNFEVTENVVVNIHIGKGWGEYLFSQKHTEWSDITKLRSTLNDLFTFPIEEELVYCEDKIIRCQYIVPYEEDGLTKPYIFKSVFGTCWFWQEKWEKKSTYEAWLPKNKS